MNPMDKRIVEVANSAQDYYRGQKVIFISLDIYARMFGLLANVKGRESKRR